MAENNLPKQDFAPPWLKFPTTDSSKGSGHSGYQNERAGPRRDEPHHPRPDYNRLQRQTSFDFYDVKRYPQSQVKYRHHSVDDDYYGYSYAGYGYYPPNYSYEKYGMHYSSQPSLARMGSRDGKYAAGRFSQQGTVKRNYYEKDHHHRDADSRNKDRSGERDKPYSDDFPTLKGSADVIPEQTKPASGVWENPPKSNRNDESSEVKSPPAEIYKALLPARNGQLQLKKSSGFNGIIKDGSPPSPCSKVNLKEGTRQSPTTDLTIVTQIKKLGDKKSEFLKALRNETSHRNGDVYQDMNQNSVDKHQVVLESDEICLSQEAMDCTHINGSKETNGGNGSYECLVNGNGLKANYNHTRNGSDHSLNSDVLTQTLDHVCLSGEDEEKRLLESMGWSEEDQTEYVITDDDVREFHHMLKRVCEQGNPSKSGVLRLKLGQYFTSSLVNGTYTDNYDKESL